LYLKKGAERTGEAEDSVVAETDVDKLLGLGLREALLGQRGVDHAREVTVLDVRDTLPADGVHGPDAVAGAWQIRM
jgi:hypothetical protein